MKERREERREEGGGLSEGEWERERVRQGEGEIKTGIKETE